MAQLTPRAGAARVRLSISEEGEMHNLATAYDFVIRMLSNEKLYLIYLWSLLAAAVLLALLRAFGIVTDEMHLGGGLSARVIRGPESTAILSAAFATVVAILNIGVAQLVFPLLPFNINRFAFIMVVIETMAWAYLIYRLPWLSNWLIGLRS